MKYILGFGMLMLIGVMGWQVGERLDPQAVSMALGVLFGMMAGLPVALMVLAAMPSRSSYHAHAHYHEADKRPTFIVHNGGRAGHVDRRLRPTGEITGDGYELYQGPADYVPSQVAKDHPGYSTYRVGGQIAMKENDR